MRADKKVSDNCVTLKDYFSCLDTPHDQNLNDSNRHEQIIRIKNSFSVPAGVLAEATVVQPLHRYPIL